MLIWGVPYIIGKTGYGTVRIQVTANELSEIDKNVTASFLGIPSKYGNYHKKEIDFMPSPEADANNQINNVAGINYNSSTIYIPLDLDVTTRVLELRYNNIGDIFRNIGGLFMFVQPFLAVITVALTFNHLHKLAAYYKREYQENHRFMHVNFLRILFTKVLQRKRYDNKYTILKDICHSHFLKLRHFVRDSDAELARLVGAPHVDHECETQHAGRMTAFQLPYSRRLTVEMVQPYHQKTVHHVRQTFIDIIRELSKVSQKELERSTSVIHVPNSGNNFDGMAGTIAGLNKDSETRETRTVAARLFDLDFPKIL